jgi:hypothetical protein
MSGAGRRAYRSPSSRDIAPRHAKPLVATQIPVMHRSRQGSYRLGRARQRSPTPEGSDSDVSRSSLDDDAAGSVTGSFTSQWQRTPEFSEDESPRPKPDKKVISGRRGAAPN